MGLPLLNAREVVTNDGLRTPYGLILPPGANVAAYVRSTGVQSTDSAFVQTNLVSTLAQGLARARAGLGDFVVCLPGHAESVADATTFSGALQAGTKIIGIGRGSNTPTFTWTTTGSQWLVNKADVSVVGLRLVLANAAATTLAIQVTAADFGFYYNDVVVAGTQAATRGIQLAAGADRADVSGNIFRGAIVTSSIPIDFPAPITDARFCDNEVTVSASANGIINIGLAATGLKILRNVLNNTTAASTVAIVYANVAITGQCAYNTITVLNTGAVTPGTTGITVGGTSNLTGYFQNFVVNDPNKSGLLLPVVDT